MIVSPAPAAQVGYTHCLMLGIRSPRWYRSPASPASGIRPPLCKPRVGIPPYLIDTGRCAPAAHRSSALAFRMSANALPPFSGLRSLFFVPRSSSPSSSTSRPAYGAVPHCSRCRVALPAKPPHAAPPLYIPAAHNKSARCSKAPSSDTRSRPLSTAAQAMPCRISAVCTGYRHSSTLPLLCRGWRSS